MKDYISLIALENSLVGILMDLIFQCLKDRNCSKLLIWHTIATIFHSCFLPSAVFLLTFSISLKIADVYFTKNCGDAFESTTVLLHKSELAYMYTVFFRDILFDLLFITTLLDYSSFQFLLPRFYTGELD